MYRSFILGLLLSIALVCGVGFWLTSREKKDAPPPPAPEVAAPVARSALPRPAPARPLAEGSRLGALGRPMTGAQVLSVVKKAPADDRDLEEAIATAVRAGDDRPTGTVDKEQIRAAIKSVKPLVNECFRDAQRHSPPPQKVVLRFTLREGRFVGSERVESTLTDPMVEACVLDSLLDAQFTPSPTGEEVTVTYPFRFEQDAG